MANTITPNSSPSTLINALLAQTSGITILSSQLTSATGSANLYGGGLQGIGSGILLTSGYTPGAVNDSTGFGGDNGLAGSAALDAVVNTVFQTQSFNATELSFSFTVSDPSATSVSFDLVFGSEEYPEWVDAFVDVAVVMVNGVNVALFDHNPNHPLSVISPNLAAGYFVDNANGAMPTQYDGVSALLKFVAPIHAGVNTITIAIADTGDGILDSGIFVSNLSAGTTPGSGVVSAPGTGTSGNDTLTGTAKAEYFELQGGDDTVYAGAGDDIVVAGAGNDAIYAGSGADEIKGDAGDDFIDGGADSDTAVYAGAKADYDISFDAINSNYTVTAKATGLSALDGKDTLVNVEFAKFGDGTTWSLDTNGTPSLSGSGGPVVATGNQPGSIFLSGVGGQGQTLTAKVSDVDGVPATGVIYFWQANGVDLGVTGNTFAVGAAQVGQSITVSATYTDLLGHIESLTSTAKSIAAPGNGDFAITLLNLKAPIGASVMSPLTTLVQNAIELGVSPNEAALIIKVALGIDPKVDLQHYDSWAKLQENPNDAAALAVEKKLVQVAVMTSLGSDETGMALTQAIFLANSNNTTLDLADEAVIANLLGLDLANGLVHEIWDRNDTIGAAADVAEIDAIWIDIQSGLSVNLSDSIGTLSVHINQAPVGSANATLASGTEGNAYVVNASELLAGFTDPEGGALNVANFVADHGTVTAGDGGFTITPDAGYSGPIELTYNVVDDQGLAAPAKQLFVVTPNVVTPPPTNQAPAGSATAALPDGSEDTAYTVAAADLLQGFTDPDADAMSLADLTADHGTVTDNGDGTFTLTPDANYYGAVNLNYNVTDGKGGSAAATQSFNVAAVNDAPVLTGAAAALVTGTEDTAYTITAADLLAGFADVDGDTLSISNLTTNNGTLTANGPNWTFVPNADFNGPVALSYNVIDSKGGSAAATQSFNVAAVNDAPVLTGAAAALVTGTEDTAYTITAADLLAGFTDVDGDTLSISNLTTNNGTLTANGPDWTFVPNADFNGPVALSYNVIDSKGGSVAATQSFNVAAVNDAPVLTGTATALVTGTEDTAYTIYAVDLMAGFTDVDGDTMSITNLTASNGTLAANASSWTFTPNANFNGAVALSYNLTDGKGGSVAATQSFNVAAVNDSPTAVADTANATAQNPVLIDVLANDSDVDNAGIAVANAGLTIKAGSLTVDPLQGTAQIVGNQIEFTSAANFAGVATISYIATDGADDSAVTHVTLTVTSTPVTPGVILGTAGKDKLMGTSSNDWIDGGKGADTMSGGLGDDTYIVDNKGDRVRELAGQGTDTVNSSVDFELTKYLENLTLTGSANLHGHGNVQANILIGNAGRNELDGGDGNDILIGGAGKDQLVGGGGSDIFKLLSLGDSVVGSGRDVIDDFKLGLDRIDLSEIDAIDGTTTNDAFEFITTGFTHVAGQLRFDSNKGVLSGDVNGDGLADFSIELAGVSNLNLSSFIL